MKDGFHHGSYKTFHPSGSVWVEGTMNNGKADGKWREYTEGGTLVKEIKYKEGNAYIDDGEVSNIYDLSGNLIYSYVFIDGKRNGSSTEILHMVPYIKHDLELNKISRYKRCQWRNFGLYESSYPGGHDFRDYKKNIKMTSYNAYGNKYDLYNYMNSSFHNQYNISWIRFSGIRIDDKRSSMTTDNKIIGSGNYKNNVRIGKWSWKVMGNDKVILKGQYNDEGAPIGEWVEEDPKDDSNLIITKYTDEGKVISVSKRTITYSTN
tara:strand:- start:126 stop:917 length:792 start_codon:yes stop_codon:yes gene_type:complete